MKSRVASEELNQWTSFHLYYHEDRGRVLRHFIPSLAHDLIINRQAADRFFFIQYSLGGPHLRIRFRHLREQRSLLEDLLEEATKKFLAISPSRRSIDSIALERANETILTSDPTEHDHSIYPDNFFMIVPFQAEVERYGGENLLSHSLDFFCASSLAVLDLILSFDSKSRAEYLYGVAQLLFAQAVGMADSPDHLKSLLSYITDDRWEPIRRKADDVYDRNPTSFFDIVSRLSHVINNPDEVSDRKLFRTCAIHAASSLLARRIRSSSLPIKARILGSQMHMTANRMGLLNADEVYIGRLLWRALEDGVRSNSSYFARAVENKPFLSDQKVSSLSTLAAWSMANRSRRSADSIDRSSEDEFLTQPRNSLT